MFHKNRYTIFYVIFLCLFSAYSFSKNVYYDIYQYFFLSQHKKNISVDLDEISCKNSSAKDFTLLDESYDHDNITVYKFLDAQKSSYIVFIKDIENNHYVVKQEKDKGLHKQFRALCETLGAYIAAQAHIPSHHVRLLPVNRSFPGKFIAKRIATIHTLVPGTTIRSCADSKYSKIDIKQPTDNDIPFERQGFNERTIFFMSQHSQLPKIVALDTFIGNKDRNKANIIYDNDTDSFYAIDMALMYDVAGNRKSVAQVACEHVNAMIEYDKKFTPAEIDALKVYRSVLQYLVKEFPPKRLIDLFDSLLDESGLVSKLSPFNEKEVNTLLTMYKRAIKQSYIDIKKLIYLLFILIDSNS